MGSGLHHPYGPSQAGRLAACSGSYAMGEKAKAEGLAVAEFVEEAGEGVVSHALVDPATTIPDSLSEEQRGLVEKARAYAAAKTEGAVGVYHELQMEMPVKDDPSPNLFFGTADLVAVMPQPVVRVIDFKFGHVEPNREEVAWQVKLYGSLAMYRWWRSEAEVSVFHVRSGLELVHTFKDWRGIRDEYAAVLELVKNEPEKRTPGSWCRHCIGKSICPEFRSETTALAKIEPKSLALNKLLEALELASVAEPWARAVKAHAKELLQAGQAVPGWQLGTRNLREIESPQAAYDTLQDLDTEEFLKAVKVSVPDLEEAYAKALLVAGKSKSLADGKREFAKKMAGVIATKSQSFLKRS